MTRTEDHELLLRRWLDAQAPAVPPDGLFEDVIAGTGSARQQPGWLPRLEAPPLSRPVVRLAWLVLLVGLLAAAMLGALSLGQAPTRLPVIGNGVITFVGEGRGEATSLPGGGGSDVYYANVDGTGLTRMTSTRAIEYAPAWSPDGSQLAFVRELEAGEPPTPGPECLADPPTCEIGTPGRYAIVVVSADGGAETTLLESAAGAIQSLAWSPDGSLMAYAQERAGGLFVLDVATRNARLVFDRPVPEAMWSPDGASLLTYTWDDPDNADLYLVPAHGGAARALTSDRGFESLGSWSPDGAWVAFWSDPDGSARASRVEVMAADGSSRQVLVEEAYGPAWSPEDDLIAFVKTYGEPDGSRNEVWVMAPDGTDQRKLADGGSRPRWSPDGHLVYFRHDDGIYVVARNGSGLTKLPVTEVGGLGFDWQAISR